MIEQKAVLEAIVKALDSKRAEDIQVIGVKNLTILGDYFVIANGTSTTHTKTLADEVEYQMTKLEIEPRTGRAEATAPMVDDWTTMTLLYTFSTRKPESFISWSGFGQTEKRWMLLVG